MRFETGYAAQRLHVHGHEIDGDWDFVNEDGTFDINFTYTGETFSSTDRILASCELETGDFVQIWATMN